MYSFFWDTRYIIYYILVYLGLGHITLCDESMTNSTYAENIEDDLLFTIL